MSGYNPDEFFSAERSSNTVWVVTCDDEVVGVFANEEKARAVQEKMVGVNIHNISVFGCDPIAVAVTECELIR